MSRGILALMIVSLLLGAAPARCQVVTTEDPVRIGVGARLMGMGKAFSAIADDGSAIFINPAGLTGLKNWYALSSYSSFLNEIQYLTLSYSLPFQFQGQDWGVSVGYVGAGVSNIPSPTQQGLEYFDYYNNVLLTGLALKLSEELSLGIGFRNFRQGFTGNVNAGAAGQDLDIGLKYAFSDRLTVGITGQNILQYNLGGKVVWDDGHEESIPAMAKIGEALKLDENNLLLAFDYDVWVTRKLPSTLHAGAEWSLNPFLTIRAGLDQAYSSTSFGVATNPTFGLGLKLWYIGLDYAYHPYYEEQGNVTHFFSLTYSPAIYPAQPIKTVIKPVPTSEVAVTREAKLRGLKQFQDVPEDHWAWKEIVGLAALGIMPGSADGRFKPDLEVKKIDLVRTLLLAGGTKLPTKVRTLPFKDVRPASAISPVVRAAYDTGLVKLGADRKFKPYQFVTRLEGTVLIVRQAKLPLAPVHERPFTDISARSWAIKELAAAKQSGLLDFIKKDLYPNKKLTRAELAYLLAKSPRLAQRIKEIAP